MSSSDGALERQLSAAVEQASVLRQRLEDSRRRFAEQLESLEQKVQHAEDRATGLEDTIPPEVATHPGRMIAFANGCLALGDDLAADAYIACDPVALLAALSLREKHGGRVVYDETEPPNAADPVPAAFLALFTEEALAQRDVTLVHEHDEQGSHAVILGGDDRCRRIAETLLERGARVTMVASEEPTDPRPGAKYFAV